MNLLLHVELCQMCCVFQCDADPSSEPQVIVTAQLLNFDWLFSAIFAKAERYEPSALYWEGNSKPRDKTGEAQIIALALYRPYQVEWENDSAMVYMCVATRIKIKGFVRSSNCNANLHDLLRNQYDPWFWNYPDATQP